MKPFGYTDSNDQTAGAESGRLRERIQALGIPDIEMTASVSFAVSALLEKVDDLTRDLSRTREELAEIERLVDVDCLVPVPNRRAFMRRLSWAIAMHERYRHPSSILFFDINHFKEINDSFGHAAGDLAIRHVAQLLAQSLRESDFIARLGGDEFAIIMYYASEEAAQSRARRLVDLIAGTPFTYNGRQLPLSLASGCYALKTGDDAESALSSADMAMYMDKRRVKAQMTDVRA